MIKGSRSRNDVTRFYDALQNGVAIGKVLERLPQNNKSFYCEKGAKVQRKKLNSYKPTWLTFFCSAFLIHNAGEREQWCFSWAFQGTAHTQNAFRDEVIKTADEASTQLWARFSSNSSTLALAQSSLSLTLSSLGISQSYTERFFPYSSICEIQ